MRIVHTSDWHAGKVWKGKKRLPELIAVLEHLAEFIEREKVDLLLQSGDVFDSGAPSAEAERAVFRFFKELGKIGTESIVIAGNHDSPARLDAWGILTELVGCRTVSRPLPPRQGGVIEIEAGGERALVAAVPFASVRHLVAAEQLAKDERDARATYGEWMAKRFADASKRFRADTVNLLMAHAMINGAILAGSERKVHVGREWAIEAQAVPAETQYAALGHIHKPQSLAGVGPPAYYAGSPLQLDFGEVGEEKSFVVVDVRPGQPARIERVPYVGGKPLVDRTATLEELEYEAEDLREDGWLRVTVPLETPDPDMGGKVRRLLPNAVVVKVDLPHQETEEDDDRPPPGAAPSELYGAFHERRHQRPPEPALLDTFRELYARAGGD